MSSTPTLAASTQSEPWPSDCPVWTGQTFAQSLATPARIEHDGTPQMPDPEHGHYDPMTQLWIPAIRAGGGTTTSKSSRKSFPFGTDHLVDDKSEYE